jgi:hypothetical protein
MPAAPPRRPRYFPGQLLAAGDFTDEQDYVREKLKRHNRWLHGPGVVHGLEVSVEPGAIRVTPGLALDPSGEEIVVPACAEIAVPPAGPPAFLVLRYREEAVEPRRAALACEETQPSRIVESYALAFATDDPDSAHGDETPNAVALARLVHDDRGWRVDATYRRRTPR